MARPAQRALVAAMAAFDLLSTGQEMDVTLPGSPERCAWRGVVAGTAGQRYVVEQLLPRATVRRQRIADALTWLQAAGQPGLPSYRRAPSGKAVVTLPDGAWQISPYIPHDPLPRPGWVEEAWRGEAMARFLIELRQNAREMPASLAGDVFWMRPFITNLTQQLRRRQTSLLAALLDALDLLRSGYLARERDLPLCFCHGDFHPMNVLWQGNGLSAVIDWEFCGRKPELYDAALFLGCIGIEDPEALAGPCAEQFMLLLQRDDTIDALSWETLPGLVLATRFAWLSEWLRRSDEEMIALETDYIHLLASGNLTLP